MWWQGCDGKMKHKKFSRVLQKSHTNSHKKKKNKERAFDSITMSVIG